MSVFIVALTRVCDRLPAGECLPQSPTYGVDLCLASQKHQNGTFWEKEVSISQSITPIYHLLRRH